MIKREDFEILNQTHQMRAEGCQQNKPEIYDIEIAVGIAGYEASNIDAFYDDTQELWRWDCDIK